MPRVLVTNHSPAPQGFYEHHVDLDGNDVASADATFVKPGQSMVLHLPDEHLGESHIPSNVSVIKDFTDADVKARNADHSAAAKSLTPTSDDGARAAAGANARPAAAVAAGDGEGPVKITDEFTDMSDDELRAHITTRDSKAPHHMLGREKLLSLARTEPEAVG